MTTAPRFIAIVPAAGSGTRMAGSTPKVLLPLSGAVILEHTLAVLAASKRIESFVVPTSADIFSKVKELAAGVGKPIDVILGGETRQRSVYNALERIRSENTQTSNLYVLVHDAARCFVSEDLIERSCAAALEHKAVSAAVPVSDSLVELRDNGSTKAVDRANKWAVQTPQVFLFDLLWQAHSQSRNSPQSVATDDASLVEMLYPVRLIDGQRGNFKVTYPEDYQLALRLGQSNLSSKPS